MSNRFNGIYTFFWVAVSSLLGILILFNFSCGTSSQQNETVIHASQYWKGGSDTTPKNDITVAIATTVLHPGPGLTTWLDYHLRLVQHVVIYMDDPDELPVFKKLCEDRPVTLLKGSQVASEMTPESRLIRRQMANMRDAISILTKGGYTWLLHIDLDELLHGSLVDSHAWTKDPTVGLVTFTNHEALPIGFETSSPFTDCVYFWVNGVDRNSKFLAYGNGKSAVRLGPGVEPRGAHSFSGYKGRAMTPSGEDAMILHYPYPSYDSWLRKFNFYSQFSDHWFGDRQAPKILDFMLKSRDVVQGAHKTGDWASTREFFSKRVLDTASITEAISEGKIRQYVPFAGLQMNE